MATIHHLSYVLGDVRRTASLRNEGVSRNTILQLLVRGAENFYHSNKPLLSVAISAANKTLQQSKIKRSEIDVLLIGTNSLGAPDFQIDFGHTLITQLNLRNAYVQLVGFQNCGDSIPLLTTANALIESESARNVLILVADDVAAAGIPRILKNSYLHSDGAAAGIVSRQSNGFKLGKSQILHLPPEVKNSDPYDLEFNLDFLLDEALEVTKRKNRTGSSPKFIITHNMNRLYNQKISEKFNVNENRVFGNYSLGHCLAADVFINLSRIESNNILKNNERGIIIVPNNRSIGVFDINYQQKNDHLNSMMHTSEMEEVL